MKRHLLLAMAVTLPVLWSLPAEARRDSHYIERPDHRAVKVRYGGKKHLGYWRKGPKTGYGFRFSSYRGDPFGSDDYWDGGRCYYVNHQNFCVKNRIFNGFWD